MADILTGAVLLTNVVPAYRVPLFREIARRFEGFRILVSAPHERGRPALTAADLPIDHQRTLTIRSTWRHPAGFAEPLYVHVPYDTVPLLAKLRPSVVISSELGFRSLQAALYCLLRRNTPLVLWLTLSEETERGRGWLRGFVRRALVPRAAAILVSGASGRRYVESFDVPPHRVFTVPWSTDTARFGSVPLSRTPAAERRLLYSGQLIERKGLISWLTALSQWAEDHRDSIIEFWIAGDGPLRPQIAAMRFPGNLHVRLLGGVGYEQLASVYAQCGALVLPTLADDWAVVVNEAMAAGLPVLGSTQSQAVQELVTAETGWTFSPFDTDSAYAAIDSFFSVSLEDLCTMRTRARERAAALRPDLAASVIIAAAEFALNSLRSSGSPRESECSTSS